MGDHVSVYCYDVRQRASGNSLFIIDYSTTRLHRLPRYLDRTNVTVHPFALTKDVRPCLWLQRAGSRKCDFTGDHYMAGENNRLVLLIQRQGIKYIFVAVFTHKERMV
jgi:hypothetical protein